MYDFVFLVPSREKYSLEFKEEVGYFKKKQNWFPKLISGACVYIFSDTMSKQKIVKEILTRVL